MSFIYIWISFGFLIGTLDTFTSKGIVVILFFTWMDLTVICMLVLWLIITWVIEAILIISLHWMIILRIVRLPILFTLMGWVIIFSRVSWNKRLLSFEMSFILSPFRNCTFSTLRNVTVVVRSYHLNFIPMR